MSPATALTGPEVELENLHSSVTYLESRGKKEEKEEYNP